MTQSTEETRRKARERKRRQREREKEHKSKMGAQTLSFEIYSGTRQALQELCEATEMDQEELITLLIHNTHKISGCDKSRFKELTEV